MKRLFININSLNDGDKFPILISHYDACDAGHTRGDTEHLISLIEMSVEDGDYSVEDGNKEIELISNYNYITIGE